MLYENTERTEKEMSLAQFSNTSVGKGNEIEILNKSTVV